MKTTVRFFIILFFFVPAKGYTFAQERVIKGEVRDQNTYQPIRDVSVFIPGTDAGATTGVSGAFTLRVRDTGTEEKIVFRHVAYEKLELPVGVVAKMKTIYMRPRVIRMPQVEVRGRARRSALYEKELPVTVSVIEARDFESRGYVDAGDLLRTDHSMQVEEELSGRKELSLRGGNPDDVVVMYDGIRLNSTYDNVYDISLIDLYGVERFEIIKGGNTSLYGPEAFSGVINIVPARETDYLVRLHQQIGTYNTGIWGAQLHQSGGGFNGVYSFRKGGWKRAFVDSRTDDERLTNTSLHHSASATYDVPSSGDNPNTVGATWFYTSTDYNNGRDREKLDRRNNVIGLNYNGSIFGVPAFKLTGAYTTLDEYQTVTRKDAAIDREITDQSYQLRLEKNV
ncbi:MAG: TonB-dependent receptor, partial [Chlorobi bacterium]|nr:TonB-dependent receptor [Chlorobiota bacterium]